MTDLSDELRRHMDEGWAAEQQVRHDMDRECERRHPTSSATDGATVYAIVMVNGDRFAWVGDVNAPDTVLVGGASCLVLDGGTLVNTAQIVSMTPAG